ncbi:MAG: hypothetical protein QM627_05820 [Luteolibacter sp.]
MASLILGIGLTNVAHAATDTSRFVLDLDGKAEGKRFEGIGVVDGGGATSVLLKDYPEPQRSQILDMVYKPMFGASVSALLVEIPGDGNSTQGSMPSHMHTRDDLDYTRGYTWWVMREAKKRNPSLSLDGTAWSGPGWLGEDPATRFDNIRGDAKFWSADAVDYYVKWLQGLRNVYGLEFDAIGARNEKGVSYGFVKAFRKGLDQNGFDKVRIHAFDNWTPRWALDYVKDMMEDKELRDSIDIVSAHNIKPSREQAEMIEKMGKPYWNTEQHVYKPGFDCTIGIVQAFNHNFIHNGATRVTNWYGIAGVYPMEPYPEEPAIVLAYSPWSGNYQIREALWGYAHYGQFTRIGWSYLDSGCGELPTGGSYVTMKSPENNDYSIIIETSGAKHSQSLQVKIGEGLSGKELCIWHSNAKEQFIQQSPIQPVDGKFTIELEPDSIYSLSTTRGQQKGSFTGIPEAKPFPFPYYETFEGYTDPKAHGWLPRYTADIAGAFEITDRPGKDGKCLRQVVPRPAISWAPDWQPYTIIGDEQWKDYEVSADVYLNPGDSAAIMGRINHVGTGYGFIPKGYFLQIHDDGQCCLIAIRGKKNKKEIVGDAEQQAIIAASRDDSEGGEKELGKIELPGLGAGQWHNLKLRFEGNKITAFVDGKEALSATDDLYGHGMAGLLAGQDKKRTSTPYFDNLLVNRLNAPLPSPTEAVQGQTPIYATVPAR